ncbi:MAG TPA: ribonuclease III [Chitinophagales bacterium]|nr:ribonuclease III [Chitinophagales bacterium]
MVLRKIYNKLLSADKDLTSYIKSITGITPANLDLYQRVFQHRSKYGEPKDNNERLELLGDAILDAIVCEHLYQKYPYKEEGFITELRSRIVNRKSLNEVGEKLGLVEKLKFNRKSMNEVSRDLGGNTFEALVGAIYLDAGFNKTRSFIRSRILQGLIDVDAVEQTNTDYKSRIFHYIQKEGKSIDFKVAEEKSRNRRAYFIIQLEINGKFVSQGEGYSKKTAEQNAAMNALKVLGIETTAEV